MNDWLDAEAHADRALDCYERGLWAEAETELRKALALSPDRPEWHFNLGLTLEAAGRDEEALVHYERAAELMEDETDALLAAGMIANRLGRYQLGIQHFSRALKLDPRCEQALWGTMESQLGLSNHEDVETTYYLSQQSLEQPSARCLATMGESLLQRGQHERAGWCFREAIRLDPNLPRVRARLGEVYAATDQPQRAVQLYLRELRDDPGSIDTLLDYGCLLAELDRHHEAAEKFRRVLELEPANVDAHYELGRLAMRTLRYEQAKFEFELVLKLDTEYPAIRLALSEALVKIGKFEEARGHLREELGQVRSRLADRNSTDDLEMLGRLLLQAGLPADAAAVLDLAGNEEPADAELLRQLALARYQSGDRSGGAAASRRVLRLDPSCVVSMHNLALSALEQRRVRVAAGWVNRGLASGRRDEGLRRLRVRIYLLWAWQLSGRLTRYTSRRAKRFYRWSRMAVRKLTNRRAPTPPV